MIYANHAMRFPFSFPPATVPGRKACLWIRSFVAPAVSLSGQADSHNAGHTDRFFSAEAVSAFLPANGEFLPAGLSGRHVFSISARLSGKPGRNNRLFPDRLQRFFCPFFLIQGTSLSCSEKRDAGILASLKTGRNIPFLSNERAVHSPAAVQ